MTVAHVEDPTTCDDEWVALYRLLVLKHGVRGMAAFSDQSLRRQLAVPGAVVFKAMHEGTTIGMMIWYVQRDAGYYHLAAYTDQGYELRASYGLFSRAIDHFKTQGLRWLTLGGTPALVDDHSNGLARFKRGWSTETRMTFLCGRIFNQEVYDALAGETASSGGDYFPAYRAGEFD